MAEKVVVRQGGIGLSGLLTVAFVVLKLTGVIAWSWWWVLSPLWIPFALMFGILAIAAVIAAIVYGICYVAGSR